MLMIFIVVACSLFCFMVFTFSMIILNEYFEDKMLLKYDSICDYFKLNNIPASEETLNGRYFSARSPSTIKSPGGTMSPTLFYLKLKAAKADPTGTKLKKLHEQCIAIHEAAILKDTKKRTL